MVSHDSTKGHKESEIEEFIIHRSWRKYTAASRSHKGMLRNSAGKESTGSI